MAETKNEVGLPCSALGSSEGPNPPARRSPWQEPQSWRTSRVRRLVSAVLISEAITVEIDKPPQNKTPRTMRAKGSCQIVCFFIFVIFSAAIDLPLTCVNVCDWGVDVQLAAVNLLPLTGHLNECLDSQLRAYGTH